MNTTYHDIFETNREAEEIIRRLTYSMHKPGFHELIELLNPGLLGPEYAPIIINSIKCEIYIERHRYFRSPDDNTEELDDSYAQRNKTIAANFLDRYGWTLDEFVRCSSNR